MRSLGAFLIAVGILGLLIFTFIPCDAAGVAGVNDTCGKGGAQIVTVAMIVIGAIVLMTSNEKAYNPSDLSSKAASKSHWLIYGLVTVVLIPIVINILLSIFSG